MLAYFPDAILLGPDRQRKEFNPVKHEELKLSIETHGLMHAPVIRQTPEGKAILVAGERRIRAIKDIFALGGSFKYDGRVYDNSIPVVTLQELDEIAAEEAELDENLQRENLTWQEHAAAVSRLVALKRKRAEQKGESLSLPSAAAAVASEIKPGASQMAATEVRREVIVARHLADPDIAKAKDINEAYKVLKRKEQTQANIDLAAKVGATFTAELHSLYQGDCRTIMRELFEADKRFDVILTDPPYGMDADQFNDGGGKLLGIEHRYRDSYEEWQRLMQGDNGWCRWSYCITKPQAHAYVFCDIDRFHELKAMMEAAGWYVFRTPLVDYKLGSGRVPLPDRGPRRCYELILYAIKGNKPVTHIYPDVIPCKADENMTHGAQKPVELYQNLLMRSVRSGDTVLDTFSGSGTIFPASHALQVIATGIELNPEYYAMGLKRLQALKSAADPLSALQ